MIVGTAGHIDHGKTTLVRALTGVDTDRLKEEKARGISIELGYAYVPIDDATALADDVLGFVDVPGHERLVHTMLAGAGGIDFALLVVAADDGVMPQTREHLAILDLLGIAQGAVALTKVDRVDAARVDEVRAQVAGLLAATPLRDAPVFEVAATREGDRGVAELRAHLEAAARSHARRDDGGLFRLAVDRVFTLAGHGTVVTGTVHAGSVAVGDELLVMPSGRRVRVRGIHAQNRPALRGHAGQRCALNLAGIDKDALARGDWIADARAFVPTMRIDVRLRLLDDTRTKLADWTPLHVHLGTAHRLAHAVRLDTPAADGSLRVQLVFDAPIAASAGDRFVVRDAQAARTLGGGIVLDPQAPERRRRSAARMAWLDAIERLLSGENVAALLKQAAHGVSADALVRLSGRAFDALALPDVAKLVETGQGVFAFDAGHWNALRERALRVLGDFHEKSPDEPGVDAGRLRRIAVPELPAPLWQVLVGELVAMGSVQRSGPWLHRPGHVVRMSEREAALAEKLAPLIAAGRFDPPWVRDLAAALRAPEDEVRATLRKSAAQGRVHQVVRDLFCDDAVLRELARIACDIAERDGRIEVAAFRDALGIGRKRAIQILEFLDRAGHTRRMRDARVVRADSAWACPAPIVAARAIGLSLSGEEGMRIR